MISTLDIYLTNHFKICVNALIKVTKYIHHNVYVNHKITCVMRFINNQLWENLIHFLGTEHWWCQSYNFSIVYVFSFNHKLNMLFFFIEQHFSYKQKRVSCITCLSYAENASPSVIYTFYNTNLL